jgi:hypothetical protein
MSKSDKSHRAAEQVGLLVNQEAVRNIESDTSVRSALLSGAIARVAKEDAELLDRLSK